MGLVPALLLGRLGLLLDLVGPLVGLVGPVAVALALPAVVLALPPVVLALPPVVLHLDLDLWWVGLGIGGLCGKRRRDYLGIPSQGLCNDYLLSA